MLRHQLTPHYRPRSAGLSMAHIERSEESQWGECVLRMLVVSGPLTDAGVRDESFMWRFQPRRRTRVDMRSKKTPKTAISAISGTLSATASAPRLDPQIVMCEAYRTCHEFSWALRIPREYRCTETATPIPAPCSLSQAETGCPDFAAAGILWHRRARPTRVVHWRRRSSSFRSRIAPFSSA